MFSHSSTQLRYHSNSPHTKKSTWEFKTSQYDTNTARPWEWKKSTVWAAIPLNLKVRRKAAWRQWSFHSVSFMFWRRFLYLKFLTISVDPFVLPIPYIVSIYYWIYHINQNKTTILCGKVPFFMKLEHLHITYILTHTACFPYNYLSPKKLLIFSAIERKTTPKRPKKNLWHLQLRSFHWELPAQGMNFTQQLLGVSLVGQISVFSTLMQP